MKFIKVHLLSQGPRHTSVPMLISVDRILMIRGPLVDHTEIFVEEGKETSVWAVTETIEQIEIQLTPNTWTKDGH